MRVHPYLTPPYALLVLLGTVSAAPAQDKPEAKPLSAEEQRRFLASRDTEPSLLGVANGSFERFTNFYYTFKMVVIHSDDEKINDTKVFNTYPEFYKPTNAELFHLIQRQTRSVYRYDEKRNLWLFEAKPSPPPYTIEMAKGWTAEDRGLYVKYTPPGAPVGMDIYMLGRFSAEKDQEELFLKLREHYALQSVSALKDVTVKDMTKVKVDGAEALYLETSKVPRPNNTWRQWAFVRDGHVFVIVSSIDKDNEERLLPDVRAMVNSFKLTAK
jgi:hypothetical protein